MPISMPSAPITVDSHLSTSSDPPPPYTTYPEYNKDIVISLQSDSSSKSSRESSAPSAPSPGPNTPPDNNSSAPSTPGGKPIHINFTNPSDIKIMHDETRTHAERKCTWCWLVASVGNILNKRLPSR